MLRIYPCEYSLIINRLDGSQNQTTNRIEVGQAIFPVLVKLYYQYRYTIIKRFDPFDFKNGY